jgi:hypothetical protein
MKIVLNIAFVIVFIFSAIYVYNREKYSAEIEIVDGYPLNFSVERGSNLLFYLNPKTKNKQGLVYIYNTKKEKVDSLILNLIPQSKTIDTLAYQNGFNYKNCFSYNTKKLKSGLYLIGNVVPFLVKEITKKNAITIVFPYGNLMAINNAGGKSFDPENSKDKKASKLLSMHRPLSTSNNPVLFLHWMDSLYGNKNLNFISDLDLINYNSIKGTELLIIYGYSSFWTMEQRKNFDKFQESKGNVLAICSYLMNNKFLYDSKKMQMYFYGGGDSISPIERRTGVWHDPLYNYPNINSVGCSYEIVDKSKELKKSNEELIIVNREVPIFNSTVFNRIKLKSNGNNSIKFSWGNNVPIADSSNGKFYLKKILAYDLTEYNKHQSLGGIYFMKKTKFSGDLIVVGYENWTDDRNFCNNNIITSTRNCINYLSNKNN